MGRNIQIGSWALLGIDIEMMPQAQDCGACMLNILALFLYNGRKLQHIVHFYFRQKDSLTEQCDYYNWRQRKQGFYWLSYSL